MGFRRRAAWAVALVAASVSACGGGGSSQATSAEGGATAGAASASASAGPTGSVSASAAPGRSDPTSYVESVCGSLGAWLDWSNKQTPSPVLQKIAGRESTSGAAKKGLTKFLDDAHRATRTFAEAIEEAGVPDIPNGQRLSHVLRTAAQDTDRLVSRARAKAAQVPATASRAVFSDQAVEVTEMLAQALDVVIGGLDGLDSRELDAAMATPSNCDMLSS
jgi:hypothetical protein